MLVLQGAWSQLVTVFATCCSSFVQINSGTSGRDLLTPEGQLAHPSVMRANKLLSRTLPYSCFVKLSMGQHAWALDTR